MNDLYRAALESVNVGILVFDRRGRLVYANPAAEEVLGASFRSIRGRSFRALFRGNREAARITRKAIEENAPVTGFDVALRRPAAGRTGSGETVTVIVGASPMSSAAGEPCGAVLSIKPAEILAMVGREEEAAQSAAELQMLASGLAHEIRNPLGGIRGAAQWLLRNEGTPAERREGTELILREAARINDLVERMLQMSRTLPPPRPFSVLPLLKEAIELLRAEVRELKPRVRFELFADPSLPDASGHADTIFRAVLNIVKNAVEAVGEDGVVRIDARMNFDYRFSLGRGRKRSFIEITVSDNGHGLTEAQVRKALLPFYTTKPGGTGLGLVMARQAISRHGGKLEIRSVPGEGTAVKISLPADSGRRTA